MPLPLPEVHAVGQMASLFYDFLPAKAHPYADQSISFPAVAHELGLAAYWSGGSKLPAVTRFLEQVLEHRRDRFCALILGIVRRGMVYRGTKTPVTCEEVETLNQLLPRVRFQIPELLDPAFLDALPRSKAQAAPAREASSEGAGLLSAFMAALQLPPQPRGFAFEAFLNELFTAHELAPRGSFRLVGEQIDGSFIMDSDTYLVEAKWQDLPVSQGDLLVLHGKVEARATWARGVFVSYSGFSADALAAFARGRPTNIVGVDGLDLHETVSGRVAFPRLLRAKLRRAVETGSFFVPFRELGELR